MAVRVWSGTLFDGVCDPNALHHAGPTWIELNQPLVSSHSRSRQVQHPQQKLFLINIISWQYVREATRQFMGFTPQDRSFSHHGPREVVTLDRILHSPLCLPIRDRDKYNTHNNIFLINIRLWQYACEAARRSMVFTPHNRSGLVYRPTTLLPTPFSFRCGHATSTSHRIKFMYNILMFATVFVQFLRAYT